MPTPEMKVYSVEDDVAGIICEALVPGPHLASVLPVRRGGVDADRAGPGGEGGRHGLQPAPYGYGQLQGSA